VTSFSSKLVLQRLERESNAERLMRHVELQSGLTSASPRHGPAVRLLGLLDVWVERGIIWPCHARLILPPHEAFIDLNHELNVNSLSPCRVGGVDCSQHGREILLLGITDNHQRFEETT